MDTIDTRLDAILEEAPSQGVGGYGAVQQLTVAIAAAKQRLEDLTKQLSVAVDHLCSSLALGIRRLQPSLHVQIGNNCCRVGYLKKLLIFRPDFERNIWKVDSTHPRF